MVNEDLILKHVGENYLDIENYEKLSRTGVTNNKIYLLNKGTPEQTILKIYYKDHRLRLEREYGGYEFFTKLNSKYTPKPLFRDNNKYYAGYTFLTGEPKTVDEITMKDMTNVAEFVNFLHKNSQKAHKLKISFKPAIASCFSLQETIDKINMKVNKFVSDDSIRKYQAIRDFRKRYKIRRLFDSLINEAKKGIDNDKIDQKLPVEKQALSPVDLNFSNMLFEGNITKFIDFEDFGWDDPVNIFGFFLYHDKVSDIKHELKQHFVKKYVEISQPSEDFKVRLRALLHLGGILWLSTYLLAMTEEKLKVRRFTNSKFEEIPYLRGRIARFEEKLEEYKTTDSLAELV